ncbi:hypothetical protein HJC23_011254 [Cyclotella cryptica]|uniref:START domain-containing protein n=1 Tax=Cyclotella cryptica TaxID=29204 RepID=A0ABD3QYV5_9STRA
MFLPGSSALSACGTLDDLDNVPEMDDDDDDSLSMFPNGVMLPSLPLRDTRVEGWLTHCSSKVLPKTSKHSKRARYFVLRGETLSYYAQPHDVKAKGTFVLTRASTVGPVVYGPLEGHEQAGEEQHGEESANTITNASSASSKTKRKKRQYYCVQVTWPTNYKPTKDEKLMAQAKAQVAAENEKKALEEMQSQEETDDMTQKHTKSPSARSIRSNLHRRLPSTPRPSPFRKTSASSLKDTPALPLPPDLPSLNDPQVDQAPSTNVKTVKPLQTPAMAIAGSNPFSRNISESSKDYPSDDNNNPTSLTHETGLHKHYTQQIEKHAKDQQKSQEELQKVMLLLSRKADHERNKKRFIQGTKVAAISTAAITAGVLTAGMSLAAGLLFVGITAAAGGSGAVVGSKVYDKAKGKYYQKENQMAFRLVLGANTYDEAMRWKLAMELVIQDLVAASDDGGMDEIDDPLLWRIRSQSFIEGDVGVDAALSPKPSYSKAQSPTCHIDRNNNNDNDSTAFVDLTPKWVPLQGGGLALWGILGFGHLRVYREERPNSSCHSSAPSIPKFRTDVGLVGQPFPPLRASVVLKTKSLDAFMCLMCSGRIAEGPSPSIPVPNSGQIASFRIIETINDHMDVIHLVFRPLYLFPFWSAPRDFVLYRFWKYDDDGSYQICFDSGHHKDCPPLAEYVRGEMHSVYSIAPLRRKKKRTAAKSSDNSVSEECLMTNTVQVDPRGWVPAVSSIPFFRNQGYGDAFAVMALNQMLDVKDAIDSFRFVAVPMSNDPSSGGTGKVEHPKRLISKALAKPGAKRGISGGNQPGGKEYIFTPILDASPSVDASDDEEPDIVNYDFQYSGKEMPRRASGDGLMEVVSPAKLSDGSAQGPPTIFSHPPPTITEWWAEPDANSFRVRGKTYKEDSRKINAGSSLFRLIAADVIETDFPILNGMCLHPTERVQLALARERQAKLTGKPSDMPPFIFCVNISMPGPPNYHLVFYYAVDDMSLIDGSDGTESSKLCKEFFFEKDDNFRDNTFKLIPQIIEGNFIVRKAVGSTPAIMGNKIKQTYCRGERFFELTIDTGSSSVAAGVIRICNGYAKMIVVDLAFLFEGYDASTLPERVLGCVRLKNVEFGKKLRFVNSV